MEVQIIKKSQARKISTLAAIGLGGGIAWFLYWHFSKNKTKKYSKETAKAIMSRFCRDYYPIYLHLWDSFGKISRSYQTQYRVLPQTMVKLIQTKLLNENERFQEMVHRLEEQVYGRFGISNPKAIQKRIQELAKEDNEIQLDLQEIRKMIQLTSQGKGLDFDFELPAFVTPAKSFLIYRDTVQIILIAINDFFSDYKRQQGHVRGSNEQISKLLYKSFSKDQTKKEVLAKAKYDAHPKLHEEYLLKASLVQSMRTQPAFQQVIIQIDKANDSLIREHFALDADYEQLRKAINKIPSSFNWKERRPDPPLKSPNQGTTE